VCTFNEDVRMYAMVEVTIHFDSRGNVEKNIDAKAASVVPYTGIHFLVNDVVFAFLVFWTAKAKLCSMYGSWKAGALLDYFKVWNIVDWFFIIFALAEGGVWILSISVMQNPVLSQSIVSESFDLTVDTMVLPLSSIQAIADRVNDLCTCLTTMHVTITIAVLSTVLRFIKGFNANPRLMVLITTFSSAHIDIYHFGIIFSTIFVPLVLLAHVGFGNNLAEFNSLFNALNSSFLVLMGEYGWYVETTAGLPFLSTVATGMPTFIVSTWFCVFVFVCFIVLLNMLMVIIIEHYIIVAESIESDASAPTLWQQAWNTMVHHRETRKFKPLSSIANMLKNDEEPVHPETEVTIESLLNAFTEMSWEQAAWMIHFLDKILLTKVDEVHRQHISVTAQRLLELVTDSKHKPSQNAPVNPGAYDEPKLVRRLRATANRLVLLQRTNVQVGKTLDEFLGRGRPRSRSNRVEKAAPSRYRRRTHRSPTPSACFNAAERRS